MARRSRRERVPSAEDYLPDDDDVMEEEDDEMEEERPRRRKRRARDEDDDEEERPRRRRSRDDDDEDEDDEDDEEEEEPRSRRRKSSASKRRRPRDDDDDDDDDEDERPRKKSKKRKANNVGGWGGYHQTKAKGSNYADRWKPGKDETLVKFIEDEPFATFNLHWFNEIKEGKKGFICLESPSLDLDEECPACDMSHRPSPKALFNVVVFDEDGDPELKVLDAGTRLAGQLEQVHTGKSGPLSKHYWAMTASGTGGQYSANVNVVKARDIEEDWGFEPLTKDEIEEFIENAHVLEDVDQIPDRKEFKQVMRDLDD